MIPKTAKIHIAGLLVGDVQRCVRCNARIDYNRKWPTDQPVGWREGAEIYMDRSGGSVINEDNRTRYAAVRPCGRQA